MELTITKAMPDHEDHTDNEYTDNDHTVDHVTHWSARRNRTNLEQLKLDSVNADYMETNCREEEPRKWDHHTYNQQKKSHQTAEEPSNGRRAIKRQKSCQKKKNINHQAKATSCAKQINRMCFVCNVYVCGSI
eukprot:346180_1